MRHLKDTLWVASITVLSAIAGFCIHWLAASLVIWVGYTVMASRNRQ